MAAKAATASKPLRADAARNRQRILDAAFEVYAERGLAGTMDEIAARAGVGVGTVYRRFPLKSELLETLFEQTIGEMAEYAEQGAEMEDAWEGLQWFLEHASTLHHENRALRELLFGGDQGGDWLARGRALMRPKVAKLLDRARDQGVLRGDLDPFDMPLILMMLSAVRDYTAEAAPEVWRRHLTLVLDGLVERRDAPSELPAEPLTGEQLQAAMRKWKSG